MHHSRGFTLIELLIAMAISAVLAVGTFYLVQVSNKTKETLTTRNEYASQLTRVVRTLESDLTQWAPDRPVKDAFGEDQPAMLLDEVDGFFFTRNGWRLAHKLMKLELERSSLQRVRYRLAEPGSELCEWLEGDAEINDKGGCLIRSHTVHLDDDGSLEWRHQNLLRPVKSIIFRFMARTQNETQTYEEWPQELPFGATDEPDLFAVEFSLTTGEGDTITRLVAVPRKPSSNSQNSQNSQNNQNNQSGTPSPPSNSSGGNSGRD